MRSGQSESFVRQGDFADPVASVDSGGVTPLRIEFVNSLAAGHSLIEGDSPHVERHLVIERFGGIDFHLTSGVHLYGLGAEISAGDSKVNRVVVENFDSAFGKGLFLFDIQKRSSPNVAEKVSSASWRE